MTAGAMLETASRLWRTGLDLLYPPRCLLCGRGGAFVCEPCLAALPRADGERCERCWRPLNEPYCIDCLAHPLALRGLRSAWRYEDSARRLVHAFKFGGQSCLTETLTDGLAATLSRWQIEVDAVVPVPLTARRRRQRGFNQAALLAERLGRACDLPVGDVLIRTRFAGAQTRLSAAARRRNVQGAFALRSDAGIDGLRLLLIDDVATTGATLDACARVLLTGGARAVYGLTIARED